MLIVIPKKIKCLKYIHTPPLFKTLPPDKRKYFLKLRILGQSKGVNTQNKSIMETLNIK